MNHAKVSLYPSYPAPSEDALLDALGDLIGISSEFQIDLVDGHFSPGCSWPFTEAEPLSALAGLAPHITQFDIEFDLMVTNPLQYFASLLALKPARIIIHYGSTDDYAVCIKAAKEAGVCIGLAVLPTVSYDEVAPLLEQFEYVQVMGIREVGKQGQPFAPETIELVRTIRAAHPTMDIAIDGSVNVFTIPLLVEAGATRLAPGSAIIAAPDRIAAYRELQSLANSTLS